MKTILDDIRRGWLLVGILYHDYGLKLRLIEPKRGEQTPIHIGEHVFEGTRELVVDDTSREFEIIFERVFAVQVVDESYWQHAEYHEGDDKTHVVTIYSRSDFLDSHMRARGWMFDHNPPLRHFCIGTYEAVIDVLSCDDPVVKLSTR